MLLLRFTDGLCINKCLEGRCRPPRRGLMEERYPPHGDQRHPNGGVSGPPLQIHSPKNFSASNSSA